MPVLPRSLEIQGEIAAIRRDIHAHPELAYGVIGTLHKGNSLKSIGLRADMDALPMDEVNDFQHRSQNAGRMQACGHFEGVDDLLCHPERSEGSRAGGKRR